MTHPPGPVARREFLELMATATAGLLCAPRTFAQEPADPKSIPKRRLGANGPEVTMLGLGERSAENAKRHLAGTLARLRTDHLDLWQYHSVRCTGGIKVGSSTPCSCRSIRSTSISLSSNNKSYRNSASAAST